jgi:hypothetical protein
MKSVKSVIYVLVHARALREFRVDEWPSVRITDFTDEADQAGNVRAHAVGAAPEVHGPRLQR